jgi:aminoglycoside phosphotransferase (APT) family kinase protein
VPGEPPEIPRPSVSHRDPHELSARLREWLSARVRAEVTVTDLQIPESNGMSSETALLDATWDGVTTQLVAKIAPTPQAVPVFPRYDMGQQFATMKAVRENSAVPVPQVLWLEDTGQVLGEPFFVMQRVTGDVPPDVMPYNFGSWLTEASEGDLRRLQDSSVQVLAGLHAIHTPESRFGFLGPGGLSAHVAAQRKFYDWVCGDGLRSPLIEKGFAWLLNHWPASESETVLSWGDARIGNIMYQDFTPVAVLDWEMAALAPREVDLGWFIYLHRFFEDIAGTFSLDGMPAFLRRGDITATYQKLTGYPPRDMDFYTTYAALRHAIIMFRIQRRAIQFGDATVPTDPDEMIMHHRELKAMLAGTYWNGVS